MVGFKMEIFLYGVVILNIFHKDVAYGQVSGISPKLDFQSQDDPVRVTTNNSEVSKADDDVEVKHTIVVSTKLRNNNRRGLHSSSDDDVKIIRPPLYQHKDPKSRKDVDSEEVPVIKGYRALESTRIETPDTRFKSEMYPDSVFVNYNINREGFDVYQENAAEPRHWKPSSFYNNINWQTDDNDHIASYNLNNNANYFQSRHRRPSTKPFSRKLSDDAVKEFYCSRCRELSHGDGTSRPFRRSYETTTKIKIDGKLAKLD